MSTGLTKSLIYFSFVNSSIVSVQFYLNRYAQTSTQKVSFSFKNGVQDICVSYLCSSSSYSVRRSDLWQELSNLSSQISAPLSFLIDFIVVPGSHEYRGKSYPSPLACREFQDWFDQNSFIHLPSSGRQFTWTNGHIGDSRTDKRLGRDVCNTDWINL